MAEQIDEYLRKQSVIYDQMKTFNTNYSAQENRSAAYIEGRVQGWDKYWDNFIEIDYNLQLEYNAKRDAEKPYFRTNMFAKLEGIYYHLKGVMNGELSALGSIESETNSRTHSKKTNECKLPVLEPPKFNGNFLEWPSFKDLFKSTIHSNNELSSAQKLQYLKASLIGDASKILRTTQITDNNYASAWRTLEERFEIKSALVHAQIQALFTQPKANNSDDIKNLYDTTIDCLNSLTNMEIAITNWDPILIYLIQERLPASTLTLWNQLRFGKTNTATWLEMKTFLQSCCLSNSIDTIKTAPSVHSNTNANRQIRDIKRPPYQRSQSLFASSSGNCKMRDCKDKHSIRICPLFIKLDVKERIEMARQANLCLNCLGSGHKTAQCSSEHRCQKCQKKHHSQLHLPTPNTANTVVQTTSMNSTANFHRTSQILLATAIINVQSSGGLMQQLRALIDNGSQSSFITERAVQKLNLRKSSRRTQVYGLGRTSAGISSSSVRVTIGSTKDPLFALEFDALVMPKLTDLLPSENIDISAWKHLSGIQLADPNFFDPGHVDILIGANVYASIILSGVKTSERGMPLAQETVFGWILTGPTSTNIKHQIQTTNLHQQIDIDQQLRRFFEDQEMPIERQFTGEEKSCEEQFQQSFYRDETGRYVVPLPFKTNVIHPLLGDSYGAAINRLRSLERRFHTNHQLASDYAKCLAEYVELDHMELVNTNENDTSNTINYLAHQAVIKLSSNTTQLRVVFDASNKTTNGRSLNDILLVGPRLQQDLAFILLRWRKHKFVLSADIAKMYRQVSLHPAHRNLHRILWRAHADQPIQTYRMKRVTFGVASAQYMAVKALQQLADDEKEVFPLASVTAKQDFYVDDLFTGASTVEYASELQTQLIDMLKRGGFPLRQWSSNCQQLIERIPLAEREYQPKPSEDNAIVKTLGVHWVPKHDHFIFRVKLDDHHEPPTKRNILSDIAKIYDPPGWLAPIIIVAKLVLKRLWLLGKDWDEELPADIVEFWSNFRSKLHTIEQITIPRWLHYEENHHTCELHGFCDASEKGYAAVVYTRIIDPNEKVYIHILASKTRVSPMKPISLPRLELNGATLLAKLIKRLQDSMQIKWSAVHAWCDSQIALQWIHGEPQRWKTYVSNRVVEIHSNLNCVSWHYVRSAENPADCASRGIQPNELKHLDIWFHGPSWLKLKQNEWPIKDCSFDRTTGEERAQTNVHIAINDIDLMATIENLSSLTKIFRSFAWCFRFVHNCTPKHRHNRINGPLLGTEIESARKFCLRSVQRQAFATEINDLQSTGKIDKTSKLWKLNPVFDDKNQLLRVYGRLKYADIPEEQKYPIILPNNHKFTSLLIQHVHEMTLHAGVQLVLAYIRKRYWILDARNVIRRQIWKCVKCYRFRAERVTQLMGDLPVPRVNFSRSFAHTGVDFAGPIDLRTAVGRGKSTYKGYFAIFICLATRAIHLEAVTGLSTDQFIASFDRFVSRRGVPTDMYSDCGTNFVGAKRTMDIELHQCLSQIQPKVAESLANREISWHFNPPSSPHFGGLWEAGVKSVKFHMRRSFGNKVFTYEELSTALCQIESCLNSRPLCPQTNDPDDLSFLSPADLLGINTGLHRSSPSLLHINENRLSRWQHVKFIAQNFWKKYSTEFLSRMQERSKWNCIKRNLRVGDMVFVCDELASPNKWPIARIINTHQGQDGLVRVVTIKTQNGTYKRPISKLALLPFDEECENPI